MPASSRATSIDEQTDDRSTAVTQESNRHTDVFRGRIRDAWEQRDIEPIIDDWGFDEVSDWSVVEASTEKALRDVVQTADGPYAVGAEGHVLRRSEEAWDLRIDAGSARNHDALTTAGVTDDGKRIWFAGSSGALGMYDTETGKKHDYSAPEGWTST